MPLVVRQGMTAWVSQHKDAKVFYSAAVSLEKLILPRCKSCQMQYLRFLKPMYWICAEVVFGKWHKTDLVSQRNIPIIALLGVGPGNTLVKAVGHAQICIKQLVSCIPRKVKHWPALIHIHMIYLGQYWCLLSWGEVWSFCCCSPAVSVPDSAGDENLLWVLHWL